MPAAQPKLAPAATPAAQPKLAAPGAPATQPQLAAAAALEKIPVLPIVHLTAPVERFAQSSAPNAPSVIVSTAPSAPMAAITPTASMRAQATPPPLPVTARPIPPPLPPAEYLVPVTMAVPERPRLVVPSARYDLEPDLPNMFDGAARRRRMGWIIGLLTLSVLAAVTIATIASHFRPM